MKRVLRLQALDGTDLAFDLPPKVNKYLVLSALKKIHQGGDEAAVMFGLTRPETEVVAEIVAKLQDHRAKGDGSTGESTP